VTFASLAVVAATLGTSFSLVSIAYAGGPAPARAAAATSDTPASGACALLTPADIAKATGLKVGDGAAGRPIPGVLGRCTWAGSGNTKVIVTLADAQHMQMTIAAQQQTGGTAVPGLGSKAVGIQGAAFTGGGYIVNVLDAKGGFGLSILGESGTRDRVVALAKIVESRR
jgi:hypothetical protein